MKNQEKRPVVLKSTLDHVKDFGALLGKEVGLSSRAKDEVALQMLLQLYRYTAVAEVQLREYHFWHDCHIARLLKDEMEEVLSKLSECENITPEVKKGAEFIYSCLTELGNNSVIFDGAD